MIVSLRSPMPSRLPKAAAPAASKPVAGRPAPLEIWTAGRSVTKAYPMARPAAHANARTAAVTVAAIASRSGHVRPDIVARAPGSDIWGDDTGQAGGAR